MEEIFKFIIASFLFKELISFILILLVIYFFVIKE